MARIDAWLRTHGPRALLVVLAARCRELAREYEDAPRWLDTAAHIDAVLAALSDGEDEGESSDEWEDDDSREEEGEDASPPETEAADSVEHDADRACSTNEDAAAAGNDNAETPADEEFDPEPLPASPTRTPRREETTSMVKDRIRFPDGATLWRASRVDEQAGKPVLTPLRRDVDGADEEEFAIRLLTKSTLRTWWGPGQYVFGFFHMKDGRLRSLGRTRRPLRINPRPGDENFFELPAEEEIGAIRAQEATARAAAIPMPAAPAALGGMGASGFGEMMQAMMSMMTMMRQESRQEAQALREA
ncbi:MAG: hypothetical protein H0X39_14410, partial [Actinobacteria bacterium]|nr:hypothetical protein [Actinomycetota bacterium]